MQRAEQSRQPCAQQKGAQQLRLFPAASVQVCQRAHLRSIALRSALKDFELNAEAYSDWSITVLLQMFVVNLLPSRHACRDLPMRQGKQGENMSSKVKMDSLKNRTHVKDAFSDAQWH